MAFRGWNDAALQFFEGLEADNSKTYWTENRATYDNLVLAPMLELLGELHDEFGDTKVFRPYRDVRFSKDKLPYKTNIGAMIGEGYIGLSATGLGCGAGYYHLMPDQLERYREAVATDKTGSTLEQCVAKTRKLGVDIVGHGRLATAPRGYPKDHPRIELLRNKGITTWKEWEPAAWLGTPKAKTKVVDVLRAARPLLDWLAANVGPSEHAS